jgi:hypothetical protein
MIYLVDGHNLIPKVPGLSLEAEDDELQLIDFLQNCARIKRRKFEVYFDRAAIGKAGTKKFGLITAHFIRQGSSADQAIRQRLENAGKESRYYFVVSSDRAVQNSARLHQAQYLASEDFALEMITAFRLAGKPSREKTNNLNAEETEAWMKIFGVPSDETTA